MSAATKIFLRKSWWIQVVLITLVTVFLIQFFGLLGTKILAPRVGWGGGIEAVGKGQEDSWETRFARWDSGYYLSIAENGYTPNGTEQAFFPLYPILVRVLNSITNLPILYSGLIISVLCFTATNLLIYKWVSSDYNASTAKWTILWICAFPVSFFFISFYPTSLFLLTSVASIYFARRGMFIASGLSIAFAGAARPMAFLLAIPFVLEFWQHRDFSRQTIAKFIVGSLIAPLGFIGYMVFLMRLSGNSDILTVFTSNYASEFRTFLTWPWTTLIDGIQAAIIGKGINPDWFSRALAWHDLLYALLGMMLAIWALFNIRLSIAMYLFISVLFFFMYHGPFGYAFWSTSRRVASLIPIYLVISLLMTKVTYQLRWVLLILSFGFLGIFSAWFSSGRWIA